MLAGEETAILDELSPHPSRAALQAHARRAEAQCVTELLQGAPLAPGQVEAARSQARQWILALRSQRSRGSGVDALMREFSLSSQEGVALMCLAEALARIPDRATADALIRDKLAQGDWRAHIGTSRSIFVNAAAWGLMITGKLVATHSDAGLGTAVNRLLARGGEPLIRGGVDIAMRLLGQQFVLGRTIEQALSRSVEAQQRGYLHSYDMLGEAALTGADALRYCEAYAHAIETIGATSAAGAAPADVSGRPGISVKLSALHPRFTAMQPDRIATELVPRVQDLCRLARRHGIGLNIDAEESERMEPTLDVFAQLAADPALADWDGLGLVIQTYQKRALPALDWLADLAVESGRRFMVRLVKGAYWDSEIKRAQQEGQSDYPVYTRKIHTDLAYLVCAQRLLWHRDRLFAQIATHNALTLAAVLQLAGSFGSARFELQCLHGMGESLYDMVVGAAGLGLPCRIYAPVGSHETLLAYLVRRLLENGANSSFVNRVVDESVDIEALLEDPVAASARDDGAPHPSICLPGEIFGSGRRNSAGIDLLDESTRVLLRASFGAAAARAWIADPLLAADCVLGADVPPLAVRNPSRPEHLIGTMRAATDQEIEAALAAAQDAGRTASSGCMRAQVLESVAQALQERRDDLMWLAVCEAGKTVADAAAEVREAIDFCRYYAGQARALGADCGAPLGTVVAISPWNFPLAIFTGQVAAALAAGNCVLAKPAEQTPLIAALAVRLMHAAGVPRASLQLLPGDGAVGARLVRDRRVRGVLFTGSGEVATLIDRAMAQAAATDAVLVAETGGQNAMIVDSSAQPEQVVQDALASAFGSAGQRCSALRVLCLQEEIAEPVLQMLLGAARELRIGDPLDLASDLGPVIDEAAHRSIESHVGRFGAQSLLLRVAPDRRMASGNFVAPAIVQVSALAELQREVFGPVLHVLRWRREELGELIDAINATGYALTCGIHSRIDETIDFIAGRIRAGNVYVNRNMVGAVVGSQPFGGQSLSGTGPKAGGPWTVRRLRQGASLSAMAPTGLGAERIAPAPAVLVELQGWLEHSGQDALAAVCREYAVHTPIGCQWDLPGVTGESNTLRYRARGAVLCLGKGAGFAAQELLAQLAAVAATGNLALLVDDDATRAWSAQLPASLGGLLEWTPDWHAAHFAVALHAGDHGQARALRARIAQREGARIELLRPQSLRYALDRLVVEQVLTINTAAAGGNASLMSLQPA